MARRQASKVPEGTEQIETIRLLSEKPLALNFPYSRQQREGQGRIQVILQATGGIFEESRASVREARRRRCCCLFLAWFLPRPGR